MRFEDMSNSGRMDLVPDKIWHLDWYDGVIRGIAKEQDHYYLFTLVAWNPDSRRRTYVILNLDHSTADEMIPLCKLRAEAEPGDEERYSQLNQIYDRYVMSYQNASYFSQEKAEATNSFTMTPIPRDHIPELQGFDIENTMDPKAHELWFNMQTDD